MNSRKQFVTQVANTIRENHNKLPESFIFGISGKWGEGKTKFLTELKDELKGDFDVVWINPWKYANDKVSFLRTFLKELATKRLPALRRIRDFINNKDRFRELYFDTTENKLHWGVLIAILLYGILGLILYLQRTELGLDQIFTFVKNWKWLISLFAIPIAFPVLVKIISPQRSSKSISTLDQFDDYLKVVLKSSKKKIVVFVDDLDRVTPEVARIVLDNLRTFFDKKELSFVVTGDHSVLERFLGKDLLPDGTPPEQTEEGRRFLKKIFNVYWRLPLPINPELESFLDDLFSEPSTKTKLSEFFQDDQKLLLRGYLAKYFEKNFRQIIRFLESVLFTFQIIKTQHENSTAQDKSYYKELLDHPLLVVRILMIQELCAPLFDEILKDQSLIFDLEYAVDKKNPEKVSELISRHSAILSNNQTTFIKSFLFEEPHFFEDSSLVVSDFTPFLYFAADASMGDRRGPSSEDFISTVKSGDPARVTNSVINSGAQKLNDNAEKAVTTINTLPDTEKDAFARTLLSSLAQVPVEHNSQDIFLKQMLKIDLGFYGAVPSQNRAESYQFFLKWADRLKTSTETEKFSKMFAFVNHEDLEHLSLDGLGTFSSTVLANWLVTYHGQNSIAAIEKMEAILPKLKPEVVKMILGTISASLLDNIITDANIDSKNKRLKVVTDFLPDSIPQLKEKVLEQIKGLSEEIWQWSILKTTEKPVLWERQDLELAIVERLEDGVDLTTLPTVFRYALNKIETQLDSFWASLTKKHSDILVQILPQIIADQSFAPLTPNQGTANELFELIVQKAKSSNDGDKVSWINLLNQTHWIWKQLPKVDQRKFTSFKASTMSEVKTAADSVSQGWKKLQVQGT